MKLHSSHLIAALSIGLASTALAGAPPSNWSRFCAPCHGTDGAGHTRMGHMFKIADFTDPAVQKSFTDEQAFAAIKNGLVEHGSTKMKPFKTRLSDDEIKAVVAYIRTLTNRPAVAVAHCRASRPGGETG